MCNVKQFMSYERVEFTITPPIEGDVGSIPYGIESKSDNGIITELWVIIGEEIENKIEESPRYKELLAKGGNPADSLYTAIKEYGIHRAQNYLDRLNFVRDSCKYKLSNCSLAKLLPTGKIRRTVEGFLCIRYSVGDDFRLDITKSYDEDEFLNKLYYDYNMGMESQERGDYVSAYKYFYDLLPLRRSSFYRITENADLNIDLKIIRDGLSHDILTKTNIDRARKLLGDDCITQDGATGQMYVIFNPLNPYHLDLIKKNMHYVRNSARKYIDNYMVSGGVAP
ncbi:MAG: hypothetical protein A4E49_03169 [Methanosaeta sp. PtaU1.Bin112]|nr:MAG: hypothetical protein A4E49_03169 [Methanosaeta sp. PtaU1.Bin112]